MKKLIIIATVCVCFAGGAFATEKDVKKEHKLDKNSVPIQLAFFPGVPQNTKYSRVHGVKFGFPISSGHGVVNGMEASIFGSWTKYFSGLQCALYSKCEEGAGLQGALYSFSKNFQGVGTSLVNVNTGGKGKFTFIGMQFGLVNYCDSLNGMQFGLVNIIEDSPHSFIPFVNFNFPEED